MNTFSIGGRRYLVEVVESDGTWTARAEVAGTGARFGTGWAGPSEGEALSRAVRWIGWQHDHNAALEALQNAERAYHRSVASTAFSGGTSGPAESDRRREIARVEAARVHLDRVRTRMPKE